MKMVHYIFVRKASHEFVKFLQSILILMSNTFVSISIEGSWIEVTRYVAVCGYKVRKDKQFVLSMLAFRQNCKP